MKLARTQKESLAAGDVELAEKLMAGLDEVLKKKKRRKKTKAGMPFNLRTSNRNVSR